MGTRVYLARLAGLGVFDPNGDRVGRVRDAVVRLRTTNRPPQVVGLVAEMALRRRIFLPIGRVTSMDSEAVVLSTGTLNLRRFEKRPNELLVVEELLDRRVTVAPEHGDSDGTQAVVVDIGMELNRNNEWLVTRVAVREHTGRLSPARARLPGRVRADPRTCSARPTRRARPTCWRCSSRCARPTWRTRCRTCRTPGATRWRPR